MSLNKFNKLKKDYKSLGYSTVDISVYQHKLLSIPIYLSIMTLLSGIIMFNSKYKKSKIFNIILGIFLSVLIYYVNYEPELFNLENDPEELINLADIPSHSKTLEKMKIELRKIVNPEEIDREAKESQAEIINKHGGREAIINKGGFGNTPAPGEKPVFASKNK